MEVDAETLTEAMFEVERVLKLNRTGLVRFICRVPNALIAKELHAYQEAGSGSLATDDTDDKKES